MTRSATLGNTTQLVFCRENVDPDVVTRMLTLAPTVSEKIGESAERSDGSKYLAHLGTWKLDLPNSAPTDTVEEQIASWIELLLPRTSALGKLREMGYCPYLDCRAEAGSLSLCIQPELLGSLGALNVSLSIWLYEQLPGQSAA
jgi:Domain of unknown function (DUF4279)